jgi:hypothetical protein
MLKFHKRSKDGSGKCNAFRTGSQADYVIGVVFEVMIGLRRTHGTKISYWTAQESMGCLLRTLLGSKR